MKLGTCNTFSKIKSRRIDIPPMWVTVTLKEFGRFICKGTENGDKDIKAFESKHMCFGAPKSM